MNEYSFLVGIAVALLAGAMSPGPSFLVVAQHSLSKSRTHGLATAVGTGLGAALFALLAALGVTTLLEKTPAAYLVFKVAGGLYLLWLAYKIWRSAREPLTSDTEDVASKGTLIKAFVKGLMVQTSNPKTIFIIASIFSSVLPSDPPSHTAILVTVIAFVIDFAWYAIVAISLSRSSSRNFYQGMKVWFDRLAAIILLGLSVKLLLSIL